MKDVLLERFRRGQRQVSWVPEWMGWGNNAYQWLWAYQGMAAGESRMALLPSKHASWGELFPAAREALLLRREEVRFRDQRVQPWLEEDRGVDFLAGMDEFVHRYLLPGSGIGKGQANELVINVRRGDYYSDPVFRAQFGIPVEVYLREAVQAALAQGGDPSGVHVVSDGVGWCRENLSWLHEVAPVTFENEEGRTPVSDLRRVAGAERVIITNSTFSYWACYIGDALHGDSHQVVAPAFFRHDDGAERSHHLRSTWNVIEEIPGGWAFSE